MRTWWMVVVLGLFASASAVARGKVSVYQEKVAKGLTVSVYAHEIATDAGALPVWTFVSHGLLAKKQPELRFTVKRESGEKPGDYPRELINLYRTIDTLAGKGELVGEGDWTELRVGLLGRDDFRCILYTPPQSYDGVPIEAPSLQALIVTCNEAHAARDYGFLRVIARLGLAQRFYPTTPWIDRQRAEVIGAGGDDGSVLTGHLPARTSARARREGDTTVMLVLDNATDDMKAMFRAAPKGGVPLALSFDPTADSYLVWSPGQKEPAAIAAPNSRGAAIGLNFLILADADKNMATLVEDGFLATFTDADWKRVRDALEQGKPLTVPLDKGAFEIRWISTKAGIADGGGTYVAASGFQLYKPTTPAPPKQGPVVLEQVVMLNPSDQLSGMIDVKGLATFLKSIEAEIVAEGAATPVKDAPDLVVDLSADGAKNTIKLSFRPTVPNPFADHVQARLDKLPVLGVKTGVVHVQLFFRVNGGTGKPF